MSLNNGCPYLFKTAMNPSEASTFPRLNVEHVMPATSAGYSGQNSVSVVAVPFCTQSRISSVCACNASDIISAVSSPSVESRNDAAKVTFLQSSPYVPSLSRSPDHVLFRCRSTQPANTHLLMFLSMCFSIISLVIICFCCQCGSTSFSFVFSVMFWNPPHTSFFCDKVSLTLP